ncbi:MAG: threonine synthase [Hespellia sp.]|nr:threonine synthase [Hespellia sp.]
MDLLYKSTRNAEKTVTASEAILKGLAEDGGLFVPVEIPKLDLSMDELKEMSYQETAYEVMKLFLTDFTEEELKHCIASAYDAKFDTTEIAPLVKIRDGVYHLELFHGATIAFKDMALSILPHLLTTAARKNQVTNDIVILTATSGDTGKAALAGFADVPGTKIIVFYPKNGVSKVQELQMVTQKGANTAVVAIHGNFDNAQTGVKQLFEDKELEKELADAGYQFSSANSINIGRLVPQVVYYVYAYAKLLQKGEIAAGEEINVTVPTGNFGNILAAYYAKQMGVPITKLICASNENKVLFDFFRTGVYDKNREFVLTSSPSMDILISSNLERLIYQIAGQSANKNLELMDALKTAGTYAITPEMKKELQDFVGGYATEADTRQAIHETYADTGYVMDTHTAVASHVCNVYRQESGDSHKMVIASTASPYKFVRSVMTAIDENYASVDELELMEDLKKVSKTEIPKAIQDILDAQILHRRECDVDQMKATVREILKVEGK